MKRGIILIALLGLGAALALLIANDGMLVLRHIVSQGWGLGVVVAFHAVPLLLSAAAWRAVSRSDARPSFSSFYRARILREAVNDLLPAAQVGGAAAGGRILILQGGKSVPVFSAMFIDVTLESASQVIFVVLGVVLLVLDGRAPDEARWALAGAGFLALGLVGFMILQRAGGVRLIDRLVRRAMATLGADTAQSPEDLHDAVARGYRDRAALAAGFVLHLVCWIVGVGEVWLALHFIGVPCTLAEAFILESLGTAIRSAAFMIPGGLGVQEGGYVLLGAAFGISAPFALALSLTKRVREILFGGVALIAWQIFEGGRILRKVRHGTSAE